MEPLYVLKWHHEMGIDQLVDEKSINAFTLKPVTYKQPKFLSATVDQKPLFSQPEAVSSSVIKSPASAKIDTKRLADQSQTLEQLHKAVTEFDGLAITKTATNTVFSDGNPEASIMFMGEAPGADEDRQGIPFCGQSGQLLRTIIGYIGLIETNNYYITNSLFWRPPGNRKPTAEELAVCKPFVEKHIALIKPKLIVAVGATAVEALLEKAGGITKIRGTFLKYHNPYLNTTIPVMPMFHPSYLLRSPGQKRYAWQDALRIKQFVKESL